MDSSTLQLIGAGVLIAVLAMGALLEARRMQNIRVGKINPLPRVKLPGISERELKERTAFVLAQVKGLDQLPWGQHAVADRQEAERIYQGARDAITEAEGDYGKLPAIAQTLLRCPTDLGLSGAAGIIMRMSFFRGGMFTPEGVRAALAYTSRAVRSDPLSVDAWIARLGVAASIYDRNYRQIADWAIKQIRTLDPNHPRFAEAEAAYLRVRGTPDQYQAALKRSIDLAPSQIAKRVAYDRLAQSYSLHHRTDDAIAVYQQMLREEPAGTAWTWHNYSIQLLRAKRYQEALDASNHALSFFEFAVARDVNNKARKGLEMQVSEPGV